MKRIIKYGMALVCVFIALCIPSEAAKADEIEAEKTQTEAGEIQTEAGEIKTETAERRAYVLVESYEISHERIVPGEGFALTLHIRNYSEKYSAYGVVLEITNPSGVAPVYGTVTQAFWSELKPGESKTVTYEYDSWSTITKETLDFPVVITSQSGVSDITLRVPTGIDSIFKLMSINAPTTIYKNETASASLNFRILGEENVSNVILQMNCNGEMIGSSQVGNLIAGTTKTQSVSYAFTESGEYTAEFYMEYVGADGRTETEFLGTKNIEVKEVEKNEIEEQVPNGVDTTPETDYTSIMILVFSGVLILVIFIISAIILKRKR